ncbi:cupredoxin domain-containing protein [Kribbella sancticallisti]
MRSTFSRGTALALLPALGMLVLAGCGDDSGAGATPSTPPPSSAPTPTPTETPASTPNTKSPSNTTDPSGEQADVTINVTVANGKVNPSGSSIKVKAGQKVLITAISDAADQLHVHGYDKELELTPGKPTSVTFVANMKGTFEVETHESGKLVAKLVVS